MPIRWSALEVVDVLKEVEVHFKEAEPHLLRARDAIKRGFKIKNLPQYMSQDLSRLEDKLDWKVREVAWNQIQRCYSDLPQDALEAEKKKASYGKQVSFA